MKKSSILLAIMALFLNPISHAQVVQSYINETDENTTVYEKVKGTTDVAVLNEIDRSSTGFGEVVQIQNYTPQEMNVKPIEQRVKPVPSRATVELSSDFSVVENAPNIAKTTTPISNNTQLVSDTRWSDKLAAARKARAEKAAATAAKEAVSITDNTEKTVANLANTDSNTQEQKATTRSTTRSESTTTSAQKSSTSMKRKSKKRVRMPRWKSDKRTKKTRRLKCFRF